MICEPCVAFWFVLSKMIFCIFPDAFMIFVQLDFTSPFDYLFYNCL